jgi:hypothetical protein
MTSSDETQVTHNQLYSILGRLEGKLDRNTTVLDGINTRVAALETIENIREGQKQRDAHYAKFGKWIIGTALAVVGLSIAVYNGVIK